MPSIFLSISLLESGRNIFLGSNKWCPLVESIRQLSFFYYFGREGAGNEGAELKLKPRSLWLNAAKCFPIGSLGTWNVCCILGIFANASEGTPTAQGYEDTKCTRLWGRWPAAKLGFEEKRRSLHLSGSPMTGDQSFGEPENASPGDGFRTHKIQKEQRASWY